MEFEHEFDTVHGGFHVVVEEEDTGIVDEDVDFEVVVEAVLMEFFGSVELCKVAVETDGLDSVGLGYGLSRFGYLFLLVADEEEVGMVVACQSVGILESDS